jgi:geranylgeranyl reductase family protein
MAEKADLIIVGAGPGGSAAAYYAARSGLDALLIDRQQFPRGKPCGDGLMPHTASEIALMGLSSWLEEPHHGKFSGLALHTQTTHFNQPLPPTLYGPHGYVVPRIETDAKLLERARSAGARFRGGVRVTKILRSPAGEVQGVATEADGDLLGYEAPLVVVADGSGGGLAGELKAHQNVVARRKYFRSVSGPDQDHIHIFATRDMSERGGGYGWVFYLGNGHANVGAGVSTRTLERTGRNLKDFFDRFLEEPVLAEWLKEAKPEGSLKSWSLRTGMWGASRYTRGLMLVGDAGSMIHPISGEGVGYAMESGRLAASFAHAAHAGKDFSASLLSGHEKQLRKQRAREQLSGLALIKALPNLEVLETLFKASESDAAARQTMVEIFTGDTPTYGLLRHPRLLTNTLQNNIRTARRLVDEALIIPSKRPYVRKA